MHHYQQQGGNPTPCEDCGQLMERHPQSGEWHSAFPAHHTRLAPSWADGAVDDAAVVAARQEVQRVWRLVDGFWSLSTHAMLQPRFDGIVLTVLITAAAAAASLGLPRLPTELWWEIFGRCKVAELQLHLTEFQVRRRQALDTRGGGGGGGGRSSGGGDISPTSTASNAPETSFERATIAALDEEQCNGIGELIVDASGVTEGIAAASLDDLFD